MLANKDNCRVVITVRDVFLQRRERMKSITKGNVSWIDMFIERTTILAHILTILTRLPMPIMAVPLTDVRNIQKYLIEVQGFKESEMLVLMDDGRHHAPTRKNIEDAFRRITEYSNAGDVVFVHYSGHGGRVRDTSGDEDDGYDETLIPVDFRSR